MPVFNFTIALQFHFCCVMQISYSIRHCFVKFVNLIEDPAQYITVLFWYVSCLCGVSNFLSNAVIPLNCTTVTLSVHPKIPTYKKLCYVPATDDFWKHCGERRICLRLFNWDMKGYNVVWKGEFENIVTKEEIAQNVFSFCHNVFHFLS